MLLAQGVSNAEKEILIVTTQGWGGSKGLTLCSPLVFTCLIWSRDKHKLFSLNSNGRCSPWGRKWICLTSGLNGITLRLRNLRLLHRCGWRTQPSRVWNVTVWLVLTLQKDTVALSSRVAMCKSKYTNRCTLGWKAESGWDECVRFLLAHLRSENRY